MNFTKSDNCFTETDAQHSRGSSQQELEENVQEMVLINYSFSLFLQASLHLTIESTKWIVLFSKPPFRPLGYKAGTSEFSSNLGKKNDLTRVRQKESRGSENTVTSSSDVSGIVVDTETGRMPILSDQTVSARCS